MAYDCPRCGRSCRDHTALMQHVENSGCIGGAGNVHRGVRAWEGGRRQQVFTRGGYDSDDDGGSRFASLHATEEAFDCRRDEYVCALCDRGFSKLRGLNQHLASGKHAQHSYECKTCGKSFPRASHLLQHQSSSTCGAATDGHARLGRLIMSDFSSAGTLLLTNGADRFEATLRFDGAASPNPGRGGGGYVIIDVDGRDVETGSVEIPGWHTTNNQAEYIGLIHGLKAAERQMIRTLKVQGDSELVIRQMQGKYMVTSSKLRPLHEEANELRCAFQYVVFEHLYRSSNERADQLAKDASNGYSDERYDGYFP